MTLSLALKTSLAFFDSEPISELEAWISAINGVIENGKDSS